MAGPIEWTAIVALAVVGAACDLRTRRVPNAVTFGAAAIGLVVSAVQGGLPGLFDSVLGCAVGLLLFLPLFALGGMGAGDVKLLAAFGAWLGPVGAFWAAICTALAGGVLAVIVAGSSGYLPEAMRNLWMMLGVWRAVGITPVSGMTLGASSGPRLAYAVPIGVGAILTVWLGWA